MSEIAVRATPELRYRYAAGRYASVFLHGLREGRILASRCHRCARTLVPPRIACTGRVEAFWGSGSVRFWPVWGMVWLIWACQYQDFRSIP